MSLALALREQPPARVAAHGLTPELLRDLGADQASRLKLRCGRQEVAVGDLFEVTRADQLSFSGDLRRVDGIGAGMSGGRVLVDGPCGDEAGARMSGGELVIQGSTGAFAGAEMAGGLLAISGDAGPRLGGAYPGFRAGMSGGEIVVGGGAGQEAGAGMRRGLVLIGGRTEAGAGLAMLAGTVIALGGIGPEAGLANRRGSLVSVAPVELLPGYRFATRYVPPALGLQLRRARSLGVAVEERLLHATWARYSGDTTELGRGEILILDDEEG